MFRKQKEKNSSQQQHLQQQMEMTSVRHEVDVILQMMMTFASVMFNNLETETAHVAMVIMHINIIQFMSTTLIGALHSKI